MLKRYLLAIALIFCTPSAFADVTAPAGIPPVMMLRGSASSVATAAVTLIPAQGAGIKIYVLGVDCSNSGSSNSMITLNDVESLGSGTSFINPAGAGYSPNIGSVPLVVAANTALTFTPGTASSTQYCNARGYLGP